MTAYAALLRGVNVGGAHMIKMADLRALLEGLGYLGVRTHLQSGNAVFAADDDAVAVGYAIEQAIQDKAGFRPRVLIRTAAELQAVLDGGPDGPDANPSRVQVTFLEGDPNPEGVKAFETYEGPEAIAFRGRELWVNYVNGISNSQIKLDARKQLKTEMTGRNLNTVRALARMTVELES